MTPAPILLPPRPAPRRAGAMSGPRLSDVRVLRAMLPLLAYRSAVLTRAIDAIQELAATEAAGTVALAACESIVARQSEGAPPVVPAAGGEHEE